MRTLIIILLSFSVINTVWADIILDGTLGPALKLDGPHYVVEAQLGKQYDTNLFHSFSTFNLLPMESATFTGADTLEHIIGRVTGGSASKIEGVLRSDIPGVQLWMINPAGWQQLGQVEIAGGLAHASAEALRLKDGSLVRAVNPQDSVLSASAPLAFLGIRDALLNSDPVPMSEEQPLNINTNYLPSARQALVPQPNACSVREYTQLSHFVVTVYRGMPSIPDDWRNISLPPLDFEPLPTLAHSHQPQDQAHISCDKGRCDIWETLPHP
jgi:filamentous hemagglutinin family protein